MASRRRSRIKSIAGNINDVQKRLRYLETRPAPAQLARKVVQTGNIALRAVEPDVVADAAIVRRTLAPEAVISANLAVVGDPDGAAVATNNIQLEAVDTAQVADEAITNDKLAGEIEDAKLIGISASKVGPDLLQDEQLSGIATEKLIGEVTNEQLAGEIEDAKLIGISASKVGPDLLVDDQLEGISTEKLIGTVLAEQLAGGITFEYIDSVSAETITEGLIQDEQIDGISGEKIIGGIDGDLIVAGSIQGSSDLGAGGSKFSSGTIGDDDLGYNSVGFFQLQADSVNSVIIDDFSIQELDIDNLSIARRHMQDNIIIARMINNGAVQTAGLQNLAVETAKIANGAVTSDKLGSISLALNNNILTLGTGLGKSWPVQGQLAITLSVGSGAAQVAAGNHIHGQNGYSSTGGGGVPSHTHSFADETSNATGHTHQVSGTTGTPSTLKLKKEITDYQMVDVKNLLNLNLKRYKYKNQARNLQEGREWMYGYIAEEVEELGIKEIVGYDKNKEPNAINYGLISTLVLELVKVQQTEIDSLKEEIQRLKEKI
jgi:hypothetical protein